MKHICMYSFLFLVCSACTFAEESIPESSLCSREILLTFFPRQIVEPILIEHRIDKEKAAEVASLLTQKDGEILSLVETKALNKITGKEPLHPAEDPNETLREAGVRLFKESLFQVFSQTLTLSKVQISETEIKQILDEILDTKGQLFLKCIKTHTDKLPGN